MEKILVITHSGQEDTIELEKYNPQEIISELNNNETHVILIGETIYSKIDIKYINKTNL